MSLSMVIPCTLKRVYFFLVMDVDSIVDNGLHWCAKYGQTWWLCARYNRVSLKTFTRVSLKKKKMTDDDDYYYYYSYYYYICHNVSEGCWSAHLLLVVELTMPKISHVVQWVKSRSPYIPCNKWLTPHLSQKGCARWFFQTFLIQWKCCFDQVLTSSKYGVL